MSTVNVMRRSAHRNNGMHIGHDRHACILRSSHPVNAHGGGFASALQKGSRTAARSVCAQVSAPACPDLRAPAGDATGLDFCEAYI